MTDKDPDTSAGNLCQILMQRIKTTDIKIEICYTFLLLNLIAVYC